MVYALLVFDSSISNDMEILHLSSRTPFGTVSVGDSIFGPGEDEDLSSRMAPGVEYKVAKVEHRFIKSDVCDAEGSPELEHYICVFANKA